ncbi:MAG: hypothetical protein JW958_09655 [Candidatus Eisenbacteria bacterium]|nr:hypothetical protein [Candidatus Eisenbacteria bacterium]
MFHRIPAATTVPVLVLLLIAFGCGGDGGRSDEEGEGRGKTREERTAAREETAPVDEPDDQPPLTIDPNKMELLQAGLPAERLAAKYELLLQRIALERREGVFTIERSIDSGLRPIAGEHHELLAAGLIDTTLTVEFVRLAEIVLQRHILSEKDRTGRQAHEQIEKIRALIPEHAREAPSREEIPGEPGTPPPAE